MYLGACPAIAYAKEAKFVPRELKEKWPAEHRDLICSMARKRAIPPVVELSHPVVEAGVCDSPAGTALVLANFTYEPIEELTVRIDLPRPCKSVRSVAHGSLAFSSAGQPLTTECSLPLGLNDIVLFELR